MFTTESGVLRLHTFLGKGPSFLRIKKALMRPAGGEP